MNERILQTIVDSEIKPLLSPKYTTPWSYTEGFATSLDQSMEDLKDRLIRRAFDFAVNRVGKGVRKVELVPADIELAMKSLLQDAK